MVKYFVVVENMLEPYEMSTRVICEDLYKKTKQENWSAKIKTRRLRWYGHAMRLPEETPAKMALQEAYRKVKKLRGGQTTT